MTFTRVTGALLLVGALLGSALMPAHADDGAREKDWSVGDMMRGMAQVKNSRATFVERKYLSMLKEPLKFSGKLEYKAPDRLMKHTLKPQTEIMVLEQGRLEVQSGATIKKHILTLSEYPAIWAMVESMRSTLAGDLETLQRFYQVEFSGRRAGWRLKLLPLDSQMKGMVSEILIDGSGQRIRTIEFRETGGDYSVMTISKGDS